MNLAMDEMVQGEFWIVNNKHSLEMFKKHIEHLYDTKGYVTLKWKSGKTRTHKQNNALHVYCRQLAEALNTGGLDMKKTLKQETDIPWTGELVKQYMWKPVQEAIIGSDSTSSATVEDYDKVHQVLSKHLSEKFNLYIPFPTK